MDCVSLHEFFPIKNASHSKKKKKKKRKKKAVFEKKFEQTRESYCTINSSLASMFQYGFGNVEMPDYDDFYQFWT